MKKKTNKKSGLCGCVKSNLEKIQYSPEPLDDPKNFIDQSIDKAKNGLISLSEDIFLMNKDDNLKALDLGPKCNAKKRFEEVAKCDGKKSVHLPEDKRVKLTTALYNQLYMDSHINGHRSFPPPNVHEDFKDSPLNRNGALFKRDVLNQENDPTLAHCMNKKGITQEFIADVQKRMLDSQIVLLKKLVTEGKNNNLETFEELLDKINLDETSKAQKKIAGSLKVDLMSNPILKKIASSADFFTAIKESSPSELKNKLEKFTSGKIIQDEFLKETQEKCDALYSGLEKAICASADDTFLPVSSPKGMKDYLKSGKYKDQGQVANIMQTSAILESQYCNLEEGKKSNFEEVVELVNPIVSPTIRGIDDFKTASGKLYKDTTLNIAGMICENISSSMNDLDNAIAEACGESDISTKCRLLTATKALTEPTLSTLKTQVTEETREKAKKLGITDETEIISMISEAVKGIDTKRIMEAYSDYKNPNRENSSLVNSFLGIKPQITAVAQDASNDVIDTGGGDNGADVASSQETGEIRGASVNSSSVNEISYQDSLPKNKYAREAQQKTKSSLDNFYNEVANRITQVKDDPTRRAPGAAGKTKPRKRGKTAEQKLLDALKPPYEIPESREPANTLAFDDSYDTSENYYETDADSYPRIGGGTDDSIATGTPTQKDDYNDALGEKQEANEQDRIARANAGKIKPSPFKKSLGGRSSRASGGGRGPASGGSSRGSGGAFLGGGADNSIPIEVESIQEDIEALIENVYAEKARGVEGENSEHALLLLALLDGSKKKITIKDPNNENLEVDIVRNENGLKLIPTGNMAYGDPYQVFVSKVEKVIIKQKQTQYNENFDSLLKRLRDALNSESGEVPPPEKTARYRDYVGR